MRKGLFTLLTIVLLAAEADACHKAGASRQPVRRLFAPRTNSCAAPSSAAACAPAPVTATSVPVSSGCVTVNGKTVCPVPR